jgi:transposase
MPRLKWQKKGTHVGRAGKLKGTKITAPSDDSGRIQRFCLSAGNQHDAKAFEKLVRQLPKKGRVTADRGYDSKKIRQTLKSRGLRSIIPYRQRKTGKKRRQQSPLTYKDRDKVERAFAHLDRFRSIQTRFCRYATNWEAFSQLGCSLIELLKNL